MNIHDATEIAYKNGYIKGWTDALKKDKPTPGCCEQCDQLSENGDCRPGKNCPAWREWFSKKWAMLRQALKPTKH